jgi:hypothetical protein
VTAADNGPHIEDRTVALTSPERLHCVEPLGRDRGGFHRIIAPARSVAIPANFLHARFGNSSPAISA